ncbi:6-phosphogluconolactonase [Candidatus Bathyarchaeota archaeon]|nr:6-phosphogluconolactonase [Candidatus Bathyarchaeota archaeon]
MATSKPQLHAFPSHEALASTLRTTLLQAQTESLTLRGSFRLAVSAGAVPEALAAALLPQPGRSNEAFEFGKWEVFLADERAVPLDHDDSNFALLKRTLLDKLPDGPRVHPIDTRYLDDLPELASRYEQTLNAIFGTDESGTPVFDLLLLGCGPDGHLCSLFPGHPLLLEKKAHVAYISDSPKPPPRRVTLTLPVVTNARSIVFIVVGSEKKDMVKRVLDTATELTGALVNRSAGDRVKWFVDEPALEGVLYLRANS